MCIRDSLMALGLALPASGCGTESSGSPQAGERPRSDRLVDFSKKPPYVNALDLELKVAGPGRFIGSGHPDQRGALPGFLGLIESGDSGRSWRVISRLGTADLH